MIVLPPIYQLAMLGVADAGVPNRERIVLRPTEQVNLLSFLLVLALRGEDQVIYPLNDNAFWFPDQVIAPPSWLLVYTGVGKPTQTVIPETGQAAYTMHWGKTYTLFNDPRVVPVIFGLASLLQPAHQVSQAVARALAPGRPQE
jgi:hypothetical protein